MTCDSFPRPMLAIVTGRPGSGKTTLARALAQTLSCPLVSRDEINEGIFFTFSRDPELASKDRVAKCAFDAFFRTIQVLVSAEVTLVAEAAFQDQRWRIGLEPLVPIANVKVIHCRVPPEVAHQRVNRRRLEQHNIRRHHGEFHAAEGSSVIIPFEPLSLSVPSLHVDTVDGYNPLLNEIIAFITSP